MFLEKHYKWTQRPIKLVPLWHKNFLLNSFLIHRGICELTLRMNVCVSAQSCPTLFDPMDCSLPGSSIHGILQASILEWVAMSSSRGSSWSRDRTLIQLPAMQEMQILYCWGTRLHYFSRTWCKVPCNSSFQSYLILCKETKNWNYFTVMYYERSKHWQIQLNYSVLTSRHVTIEGPRGLTLHWVYHASLFLAGEMRTNSNYFVISKLIPIW